MTSGVHPLDGVRVLDLSRVVSGPFAGRMLSDLGADVVKVEPPDGDVTRLWGEVRGGLSGFFTQQNAGKRNVCVDLKATGSADLLVALAAAADIVIENFRPGVIDRLGLGWPVLQAARPSLILLSITGFGQTGPMRDRRAYAPVVQAESGYVARQAAEDAAAPVDPVLSIADYLAALHGTVAVLSALRLAERTGVGQHIDLAMLDAALASDDYVHHAIDDTPVVRLGGEVWSTPTGPILVAGQFKTVWYQLSTFAGVVAPMPADVTLADKIAARRAAVQTWLSSFAARPDLCAALDAAGLAHADVPAQRDVVRSPIVAHRSMVAEVDDRAGGTRGVIQTPYRFSAATSGVRGPAAHRGEHNAEVLADWLGLDAAAAQARADALVAAGVLRTDT